MNPSLVATLHRVLSLVPELTRRPEHSGWPEPYVRDLCERLIAAREQGDRADEAEAAAVLLEWVPRVRWESPGLPSAFSDLLDELEAHLQVSIEQAPAENTVPRGIQVGDMSGGSIVVGGLVQNINRDQVRDS